MELEHSGERFIPGADPPDVLLEHLHRYQLAAELARGRVLDVGCGSGYGAQLLARRARRAWAADIAPPAVAYAARRFAAPNLGWLVADGRRLPFPDGSFDVVVCFEMLEHVADPERLLDECARLLAPGGVAVLSTPNRPEYSEARNWTNPFHRRELDRGELEELLGERFPEVHLWGQRLLAGSRTWRLEPGSDSRLDWLPLERSLGGGVETSHEPMYFFAVCAHRRLARSRLPPEHSLLPARLGAFLEREIADEAMRSATIRETYEEVVAKLRAGLEDFDGRIRSLGRRVDDDRWREEQARGRAAELQRDVHTLELELEAIHQAKFWKLWMAYLAVRRVLLAILRAPLALLPRRQGPLARGVRRTTAAVGRGGRRLVAAVAATGRGAAGAAARLGRRVRSGLRRLVAALPRALGWIYLWAHSSALTRRSRRATAAGVALPAAPPAGAEPGAGRPPRVLMVSPYPIHPPNHGGAVRLWNLIQRISPSVDLYLMVLSRAGDDSAQRRALEPHCRGLWFHPWRPTLSPDLWGLAPPAEQLFRSRRLAERLRELVAEHRIDVLQLEYTELGQYAARVEAPRTILTEIDVTFRSRERRRRAGFHHRYHHDRVFGFSRGDGMRQLRYEVGVCEQADQVHVMSEADGEYLASFLSDGAAPIRVVPNAVDTEGLRPPPPDQPRRGVLFVGNFQHLPNVDALDFLAADIWPLVRARDPQAKLTVVGVGPPKHVRALDGRDGISVAGEVPAVLPYLQSHRLMVAPIRAGSGTRLKILEAMACGLPVVSTTIGAEGIDGRDGEHLVLADEPAALAAAVERLLTDDDLHRRLSAAGRRLVEERYDWGASAARLLAAYDELLPEPARMPPPPAAGERHGERAGRSGGEPEPEVSVVIPTRNGGAMLERVLEAIFGQRTERPFEVICVDSGSAEEDLERMRRFPLRLEPIPAHEFNHGLTRDHGAALARGRVLVFLNQDALPAAADWLEQLIAPLIDGDPAVAAVQGGIRELPDPGVRFYWDSCGHRFYFTRESDRWLERYGGVGFSTVNAALRRDVWRRHRFGFAPIMEDKKWQREVVAAGWRIAVQPEAFVFHTHDYDLRALVRRCQSEGYGWQLLDEPYRLRDMLRDMAQPRVYADLARGLVGGRVRTTAELVFPWLRPLMLYRGNRWGEGVKL